MTRKKPYYVLCEDCVQFKSKSKQPFHKSIAQHRSLEREKQEKYLPNGRFITQRILLSSSAFLLTDFHICKNPYSFVILLPLRQYRNCLSCSPDGSVIFSIVLL